MKPRIAVVVDRLGWAQERRYHALAKFLPEYEWEIACPNLHKPGQLNAWFQPSDVYIWPWRMAKFHGDLVRAIGCHKCITLVGGHYEIGPNETCFKKGADPHRAFFEAVDFLGQFRLVLVNSQPVLSILANEGELTNLRYAPNGVDTTFFTPLARRCIFGPREIGTMCRNKAAKNVPLLLEVEHAVAIKNDYITTNFDVFTKESVRSFPDEELRDIYRTWDFVLNVSHHEGMSNTLLEAASCGAIPITTPVGDHPKLVRHGETGFIVDPTVESVMATIRKAREMSLLDCAAMSQRVRAEVVTHWDWAVRAPAFKAAIEEVVR